MLPLINNGFHQVMINRRFVIYKINNLVDNKIYIGRTINFKKRINSHLSCLRRNKHANTHLQNAWNLYKEENFKFQIIEELRDINELILRETYWLNFYKSFNGEFGYNIVIEDCNKRILSEHTKFLISKNHADFRGEKGTFYGKRHTEETRKILSESKIGENHPFYGIKRPEHSRLMLENNPFKNKYHSEEYKFNSSLCRCVFSQDDIPKILEFISEGKTQREIAEIFSCSEAAVYRLLNNKIKAFKNVDFKKDKQKENVAVLLHNNSGLNSKNCVLTYEIINEIRHLRNNEKMKIKDIAEIFNVSNSLVSNVANHKKYKDL